MALSLNSEWWVRKEENGGKKIQGQYLKILSYHNYQYVLGIYPAPDTIMNALNIYLTDTLQYPMK